MNPDTYAVKKLLGLNKVPVNYPVGNNMNSELALLALKRVLIDLLSCDDSDLIPYKFKFEITSGFQYNDFIFSWGEMDGLTCVVFIGIRSDQIKNNLHYLKSRNDAFAIEKFRYVYNLLSDLQRCEIEL
jgi:hypothetical protein